MVWLQFRLKQFKLPVKIWRRGRDLNSRTPCEVSSFQDWHVRPLRHPSMQHSFDPERASFTRDGLYLWYAFRRFLLLSVAQTETRFRKLRIGFSC